MGSTPVLAWTCSLTSLVTGCTHDAYPPPASPSGVYVAALPQVPPRPAFDPDAPQSVTLDASEVQLTAGLKGNTQAEIYAVQGPRSAAQSVQSSLQALRQAAHQALYRPIAANSTGYVAGLPVIDAPADTTGATKIEREAQFAIEAHDVQAAAAAVITLVAELKGFVTKDQRSTDGRWSADLLVRVPAASFDAFVDGLGRIGEVKNRRLTATDATLEHQDVEILLANLEAALARYRDILQRATDPGQILAIERELERTRADIERIKGRLAFLRDRATYATIAVALHEPPVRTEVVPTVYQAALATGVRAVSLVDARESATNAYFGAGLSLRFPRLSGDSGRGISFDVDVMRACCGTVPFRSDWAYDALFGFDLFSESLESGQRRWLNPYLGVRVGVAQTQARFDFAAAAQPGLELIKTRLLVIAVQARLVALVGNPDGPHLGLQPTLGVDIGL